MSSELHGDAPERRHRDLRPRPPPAVLRHARARARQALFGDPSEPQPSTPTTGPGASAEPVGPGSVLGRYVIVKTLGHGGMGTVFEARDEELGRALAVKLLHAGPTDLHAQRLRREAQALARLSHPNVVRVYEVNRDQGRWFIAMELVVGRTLRQWRQHPRSWRDCVRVYRRAAEGLAAAHDADLVHRDFKPDNCVIDDHGRVRVLDFGLVRDIATNGSAPAPPQAPTNHVDDEHSALTRTGAVLGTVAYMPPEQLDGQPADARSDQFSFCVSLYEAVYGERPFQHRSIGARERTPSDSTIRPPPPGTTVPPTLRRILLRGLSDDPDQRWPSMRALLGALDRLTTPRSRRGLALVSVGSVATLALSLALFTEDEPRCAEARAQLDGIWDEQRAQEVEAAILNTGQSYAPQTWERVSARLDDYARAWSSAHVEICEATNVRKQQPPEVMDLRMRCLQQRRLALRESVEVLAQADTARVQKAVALVAGLPSLSRCDDVDALRAELPPPEDPQLARRVEQLREQLARVRALDEAGDYEPSLTLVDAVIEQAGSVGYGPVTAEAWLRRGQTYELLGRYSDAEADLERAYLLAAELGHERVEQQSASLLSFVVGVRQERHELGLQWAKTALALTTGQRSHPRDEARTLKNMGSVLDRQGRLVDALDYHQRALEMQQTLGPEHPRVVATLNSIGGVLRRQGDLAGALDHHRRALDLQRAVLGPGHPFVAILLSNVGQVLGRQGRLDEALDHHRRALDIQQAALDPLHPTIADTLNNIGAVLHEQGELEGALAHHERSLAIQQAALDPQQPIVGVTQSNMGAVLADLGRLDDALRHDQRALAIFEEALGPRHPYVASVLNNLGNISWRQQRWDAALAYHRRALDIKQERLGPDHPSVAISLDNIGHVLRDQARLQEARDHYRRALAIREQLGPDQPKIPNSLVGLAQVALTLEDPATARSLAERALAIRESAEVSPELLAAARFVLARALWADPLEHDRARQLAEAARVTFTERDLARDLAEVERWQAHHGRP